MESYEMEPPGGYHKSNKAWDWEKPVHIHEGQIMHGKVTCSADAGQVMDIVYLSPTLLIWCPKTFS